MKRLLAIDYGRVRIGLAMSDPAQIIATPFDTIGAEKSHESSATAIYNRVASKAPFEKVIIGLPLHIDDSESELSLETREFAKAIEMQFQLPVVFQDERFTSYHATETLNENTKMTKEEKTGLIDKMAASLILQAYMRQNFE